MRSALDEADAIAAEEINWRRRNNERPAETFWRLGEEPPAGCTWDDARELVRHVWMGMRAEAGA